MTGKEGRKRRKGRFTPLFLSVHKGYVFPASRRWMIIPGAVVSLLLLAYFLVDAEFQNNSFITRGELSSNHADFETDCERCHDPGHAVTDAKCSACHEKTSELTIYDFKAHYQYRSLDVSRVSPVKIAENKNHEMACGICHAEHDGRQAVLTQVSDVRCVQCHAFGSFNDRHPEFDFITKNTPDDSTLIMTHNRHTGFVLAMLNGVDKLTAETIQALEQEAGDDSLHFFESACVTCHTPEANGKNFTNIDFDRHCGGCHLGADREVIGLPAWDKRKPKEPGVETLDNLKSSGGPGILWAYSANQGLVQVDEDGEVSKSAVFHKDPWIMENLKRIRKRAYRTDGLAGLLRTSATVPAERADTLYSETIRTLQTYISELQSRSELKQDINKMNALLRMARKKLENPATPRSPSAFAVRPNPGLTGEQKAAFMQLASDLTDVNTSECQKCHMLERAAILRVQADQDVLVRAEFDHRAHILEQRCTECHTDILVNDQTLFLATANPDSFKTAFPQVFQADGAATQNIPGIENCRACHSAARVSNRCVTCHRFHPNKENRSNLLLFQQPNSGSLRWN